MSVRSSCCSPPSAPRRAFRRNAFWVASADRRVVAALGGYTPIYPLVRKLVPPLMYFRFPVKYIVFAVFACAVLAAEGWAAIGRRARSVGARLDCRGLPAIAVAAG